MYASTSLKEGCFLIGEQLLHFKKSCTEIGHGMGSQSGIQSGMDIPEICNSCQRFLLAPLMVVLSEMLASCAQAPHHTIGPFLFETTGRSLIQIIIVRKPRFASSIFTSLIQGGEACHRAKIAVESASRPTYPRILIPVWCRRSFTPEQGSATCLGNQAVLATFDGISSRCKTPRAGDSHSYISTS
jgi:hypothetical protein